MKYLIIISTFIKLFPSKKIVDDIMRYNSDAVECDSSEVNEKWFKCESENNTWI